MKSDFTAGLVFTAAILLPAIASAQLLPYPPPDKSFPYEQAIDSTVVRPSETPQGTSATLVASAMTGALFFDRVKHAPGTLSVVGQQQNLKDFCISHSHIDNDWPDHCDFTGMASALTSMFPSQHWVAQSFTNQDAAINRQIDALAMLTSPVLVPLYGSTDHWVTISKVIADRSTSPYTLDKVSWVEGGSAGPDPADPWADEKGNSYDNKGLHTKIAFLWRGFYNQLLHAPPGCNPYCDRFVLSYEPPAGSRPLPYNSTPVITPRSPGILRHGREAMHASIAEERAWESLYLAGILDDPDYQKPLEQGTLGEAFPVYAEDLDGNPMEYYLLPILDDNGDALAMVRLSMDDGAFEEIWVPTQPLSFMGVTREEAECVARRLLSPGEALVGGTLTWSARRNLGGSELRPYYEFAIVRRDGKLRARIGVSLFDGRVRSGGALPVSAGVVR